MKLVLALVIPAAGVLAVLGALSSGAGAALLMAGVAVAAFVRFALR